MERWTKTHISDFYEVSDIGSVRSVDRITLYSDGRERFSEGILLKPSMDRRGYPMVTIYADGKPKHIRIHRLVAIAFIKNQEGKRTVNHKDGIKTNNCVSNLEWNTDSENAIHAFNNNLRHIESGAKNHASIPVLQISMDGNTVIEHANIRDAERETGAWNQNISKVCKGLLKSTGGYRWQYKQTK